MPQIKIERVRGVKAPGLVDKGKNLSEAMIHWTAAGFPVRSKERQAELFAICQACPNFVPGSGDVHGCGICGCPLVKSGGILSKLKWATESCPLDPPKWTADYPPPGDPDP